MTQDVHTVHYPDPFIQVKGTIQIDLKRTGKITDFNDLDTVNMCMIMGGANLGRIGVISNRKGHPGSFDVVQIKDANSGSSAPQPNNSFVNGKAINQVFLFPEERYDLIAEERDCPTEQEVK